MRKLLVILSFILLLVVGALLALPFLLDVNQYKSQISSLIEEKTQRQVTLDGEIKLQLFPPLGLDVSDIYILQRNGESNLAHIKNLVLKVELWPLLNQQVQVESLVINDVDAWLSIDKNGQQNWQVKHSADKVEPEVAENAGSGFGLIAEAHAEEVEKVKSPPSEEVSLTLSEIKINNANIYYTDAVSGRNITLNDVNVVADLNDWKSNLDVQGDIAQLPKEIRNFAFNGLVDLNVKNGFATQDARLKLGDIDAKLNINLSMLEKNKRIEGGVYLNDVDLTPYVQWLNGEKIAKVEVRREWFSLISAAHAQGSVPAATNASPTFSWSNEAIDLTALRTLTGHFGVYFDGLRYQDYRLGRGDIYARYQYGDVDVKIKELAFLDGDIKGEIGLKVPAGAGLAVSSDLQLNNIQLDSLPEAMKQKLYDPSGNVTLDVSLKSSGKSQKQLVAALSGRTNLDVTNARFGSLADVLQAKINSPLFNAAVQPYRQSFGQISKLTASWNVTKGVMVNDDFALQSKPVSFIGKGELNLPALLIYYRFEPLKAKSGEQINLAGVKMPDILLKGSLLAPEVKIDAGDTVRGLIEKSLTKGGIKDIKNELQDKRRDIVDDLKKGLEKNGLQNLLKGL